MKSFVISLAVFLLVTSAVMVSAVSVRRSCDGILAAAEPLEPDSDLSVLSARWERERLLYRAVIGHLEVDPADAAMAELLACSSSGNAAEFMTAKARFAAAVKSIRSCETFSFDSVF